MANSPRWYNASVSCRLEWRPSRWVAGAIVLLTVLALVAVASSGLPAVIAWPLALAALAYGVLAWRRYLGQPSCELFFDGSDGGPQRDGRRLQQARLQWRGPLAFLSWRDAQGRTRRLHWWPDTLPAERRRELRLAAAQWEAPPRTRAMAP